MKLFSLLVLVLPPSSSSLCSHLPASLTFTADEGETYVLTRSTLKIPESEEELGSAAAAFWQQLQSSKNSVRFLLFLPRSCSITARKCYCMQSPFLTNSLRLVISDRS